MRVADCVIKSSRQRSCAGPSPAMAYSVPSGAAAIASSAAGINADQIGSQVCPSRAVKMPLRQLTRVPAGSIPPGYATGAGSVSILQAVPSGAVKPPGTWVAVPVAVSSTNRSYTSTVHSRPSLSNVSDSQTPSRNVGPTQVACPDPGSIV